MFIVLAIALTADAGERRTRLGVWGAERMVSGDRMTKAQDTLRIVHNFLYALAYGAPCEPAECKLMADLCALTLPMKYRWTGAELDAMRERARREPDGA
jgi:hypothetical protein